MILPALALVVFGCAKKQPLPDPMNPDEENDLVYVSEIEKPPSYKMLAASLEFYEDQMGVRFYRNEKDSFYPYSSYSWNHFSIADRESACLYDVKIVRQRSFQHLEGEFATLLELDIQKGPCNIVYPNVNVEALDRLQNMEGAVVTKNLLHHLKQGTNFISDSRFIQESLQVPWQVESSAHGLEPFIAKIAHRVEDPMEITFGDVVFFSEYVGEVTVGVYAGYGLVVSNACFRTEVRKLRNDLEYRIYRLFAGFDQVKYKLHQDKVLHQFLSNPR